MFIVTLILLTFIMDIGELLDYKVRNKYYVYICDNIIWIYSILAGKYSKTTTARRRSPSNSRKWNRLWTSKETKTVSQSSCSTNRKTRTRPIKSRTRTTCWRTTKKTRTSRNGAKNSWWKFRWFWRKKTTCV